MKTSKKSALMHKIFLSRANKEEDGCLKCGGKIQASYYQKKNKQYMCSCLMNVSPLVGTPLEKTRIPLKTWFSLIRDVLTSDAGIDIKHIETHYGLSNVSAWNILYKIKEWINMVEENEKCISQSRFFKTSGIKFAFRYNQIIPPDIMEQKMLAALPPLFEHMRESRMAA